MTVLSWHSCPCCPFLVVLFWRSCSSDPVVLTVLFWLSCYGCPVLAGLFSLFCPCNPTLTVLSGIPVLAFQLWLSCSGCLARNFTNVRYRISVSASFDIGHIVGLHLLQFDIGGSGIKLSPILLITDSGTYVVSTTV
jgi:hypothetical protein